jgi:3-oxoacyl-[acyl-carrier protein] reductase
MKVSDSLTGYRAMVCGASAGIGKAVALHLAQKGIHCILLARRENKLLETKKQIISNGGSASILIGDLDHRKTIEEKVITELEKGPIHILINNTGGPKAGPILEASEEEFLQAFSRHVLTSHRLTQLLLPGMTDVGYGRIINIVSTSVYEPIPNLGVSNTTRGAMAAWAKSVANELPPNITINNVLPGFTDTERLSALQQAQADRLGCDAQEVKRQWMAAVPEGRLAEPSEIANAVIFLVSSEAGYIRGISLTVDGGRMRSI